MVIAIFSAWGGKLGSYTTISYGVVILTSGLNFENYPYACFCKNREHLTDSVNIGEGVWLCANCMVMPGVRIEAKSVVAAGSVMTRNLDKEGWLYGGVPAKPIKPLYVE